MVQPARSASNITNHTTREQICARKKRLSTRAEFAPVESSVNRCWKVQHRSTFEHIALNADLKCGLNIFGARVATDNDDPHLRQSLSQLACDLKAIQTWHRDVEEKYVRAELVSEDNCAFSVGGLAHYVVVLLEKKLQSVTDNGLIFSYQDAGTRLADVAIHVP
jgi:hypothetical protein